MLEIQQKLLGARKQNLKALRASVQEQGKLAEAAIKQQEATMKGHATSFGTMDPMERLQLLETSRQLKAGGEHMTGKELQATMNAGGGVLRDQAAAVAQKRAEQDPLFKELMEASGQNRVLAEAKAAKEMAVKVKVGSKMGFTAIIQLEGKSLGEAINSQLVPGVEAAIKEAMKALQTAVLDQVNSAMQKGAVAAQVGDKIGAQALTRIPAISLRKRCRCRA